MTVSVILLSLFQILLAAQRLSKTADLKYVQPQNVYPRCLKVVANISLFPTARKRAVYDQFGEEGLKNGVPAGTNESGAWTSGYIFHGNPDKVFRDFFGGDNPYQGKLLD